MLRRVLLIGGNEFRLIAREPAWPIAFTIMPIALMIVLNEAFSRWLIARGNWNLADGKPTGAELSVGGQTALFSIMLLANFGLFLYRDYSTGVWDRMRGSFAGSGEIIGAKLGATWCAHLIQYVVLIVFAQLRFHLDLSGHALAVLAIVVCTVTATIALGFAMFSFFRSSNAFEATAMMGAMVLGALGGAFAPRQTLPTWSRPLQVLSPVSWTVEGFRRLFVEHRPDSSVLAPCGVLLVFAAVFAVVGVVRFNPDEPKAKNR